MIGIKDLFVLDHRHAPKAAEVARQSTSTGDCGNMYRRRGVVRCKPNGSALHVETPPARDRDGILSRLHPAKRPATMHEDVERGQRALRSWPQQPPPSGGSSSIASAAQIEGNRKRKGGAKKMCASPEALGCSEHRHSELVSLTAPLVHLGCASP